MNKVQWTWTFFAKYPVLTVLSIFTRSLKKRYNDEFVLKSEITFSQIWFLILHYWVEKNLIVFWQYTFWQAQNKKQLKWQCTWKQNTSQLDVALVVHLPYSKQKSTEVILNKNILDSKTAFMDGYPFSHWMLLLIGAHQVPLPFYSSSKTMKFIHKY